MSVAVKLVAMMSDRISIIISELRGDEGRPRDESLRRDKSLQRLLDSLAERTDIEVLLVPYLIDLSADGPVMRRLRALDGHTLVVGPFQARAIHWLLAKNGLEGFFVELEPNADLSGLGFVELEPDADLSGLGAAADVKMSSGKMRTVWCLDLRGSDPARACEACLDEIARRMGEQLKQGELERGEQPKPCRIEEATRRRWYPVVDRDCCTNCLECLNFCLFGVFGLDESESLAIDLPDACRPGCPACSRICPAGAIMFPEHNDPAISGDPRAPGAGLKPDLLQLFGGGPSQQKTPEPKPATKSKSVGNAKKTDLDGLVDGLDEMDL